MIDYFLSLGADVNEDEGEPLLSAIIYNSREVVEFLLERGAVPGVKHLEGAIDYGDLDKIKLLEAYGADVTDEAVMERAVYEDSEEIIDYLKRARAAKERLLDLERRRAAGVIQRNLTHAHYKPGGLGYFSAMKDFNERMSQR